MKEDEETKLFKAFQNGIREGKLEQKRKELEFLLKAENWFEIEKRIEQLRKEVSGGKGENDK